MKVLLSFLFPLVALGALTSLSTSVRTRLSALQAKPLPIDPNDPYAKVLEAYQKKTQMALPTEETSDVVPQIPPPVEVTDILPASPPPIDETASKVADVVGSTMEDITSKASEVLQPLKATDFSTKANELSSKATELSTKATELFKVPTTAPEWLKVSPPPPGKVPTMFNYIRSLDTPVPADSTAVQRADSLPEASEKLKLLMQNLEDSLNKVGVAIPDDVDYGKYGPVIVDHLQQYGSWYITGLALFFAVNQRDVGKSLARAEMESELEKYRLQAEESAALAQEAWDVAKDKQKRGKASGKQADLLSVSKIKALEVEKELMKKEIDSLRAELQTLRTSLKQLLEEQKKWRESVSPLFPPVEEALFLDEQDDTKSTTLAEDENQRILQVLKEMDEANRLMKEGKGMMELEAEAKAAKKTKKKAVKASTTAAKTTKKKMKKAKKATTTKKQEKKAVEPIEISEPEPTPLFASEKETSPKKTKKAKKLKKVKKVVEQIEIPEPEPVISIEQEQEPLPLGDSVSGMDESHPWAKLAPSTLSRKSVKELTAFLDERGVAFTDDSGKALPKKELVIAVKGVFV